MIIGIDNGLDGGLCAISAHDGSVIDMWATPTFQRSGKREVDTETIYNWITDLHTPPLIAIEEPLKHAKSSQAMRSMGISYGKILGMCESHRLKVKPIQVLDWQKDMLGKVPKSQTKIFALKKALELAPEEDWRKNNRCTVPHDGIVDAFLIAQYARKKYG
ncbi:MAG: hypothetical protein ACK5H0_10235 [Bacteroidota bacterium]|jgi:hypothetical protein